jgi:hypothetical protein
MEDSSSKVRYVAPRYVAVGMSVIAPYVHNGERTGLRCRVECAAGYHARVVNDRFGFDRWFHIDSLFIEEPSPPRVTDALPGKI